MAATASLAALSLAACAQHRIDLTKPNLVSERRVIRTFVHGQTTWVDHCIVPTALAPDPDTLTDQYFAKTGQRVKTRSYLSLSREQRNVFAPYIRAKIRPIETGLHLSAEDFASPGKEARAATLQDCLQTLQIIQIDRPLLFGSRAFIRWKTYEQCGYRWGITVYMQTFSGWRAEAWPGAQDWGGKPWTPSTKFDPPFAFDAAFIHVAAGDTRKRAPRLPRNVIIQRSPKRSGSGSRALPTPAPVPPP